MNKFMDHFPQIVLVIVIGFLGGIFVRGYVEDKNEARDCYVACQNSKLIYHDVVHHLCRCVRDDELRIVPLTNDR